MSSKLVTTKMHINEASRAGFQRIYVLLTINTAFANKDFAFSTGRHAALNHNDDTPRRHIASQTAKCEQNTHFRDAVIFIKIF